jgi:hypothetical protein
MSLYASDIIVASADWEVSTWAWSYTKIREMLINKWWNYRVKFDYKHSSWSWQARFKIYKNWVALSTEYFTNLSTYQTATNDYTFVTWDLIQIYAYASIAWSAVLANYRLCTTPFLYPTVNL